MPICPKCGHQIPEGEYEKCPICGAFLGKRSSDLEKALIYIPLLLGGFSTALIFGMYYPSYLLVLGGIVSFAVLLYEREIVEGAGFFVGTLLAASCVLNYFSTLVVQLSVDPITSALLLLLGVALMYYPFKDYEWTGTTYQGARAMLASWFIGILTLRPIFLALCMLSIFQGTLLISGGPSLLDIFSALVAEILV